MDPPVLASPEEVRKKWDALLSVINNVSAPDGGASSSSTAMGSPSMAAQDLLGHSASLKASRTKPFKQPKSKEWDDRHHLLYSVVNHCMQKNVRAYFDRPREAEQYGLGHRQVIRTTWQLETPQVIPNPTEEELEVKLAKWQPGGKNFGGGGPTAARSQTESAHLTVGGVANKKKEVLNDLMEQKHTMRGSRMHKVHSDSMLEPKRHHLRKLGWDDRHVVLFAKDNHHYHPNFRDYFERPRHFVSN